MFSRIFRVRTACAWLAMSVWLALAAGRATAEEPIRFNRDIRPILSDNCYKCHGPDKNTREADLRLDQSEVATAVRDGHAAIVAGKPADSELVKRITSKDADERMPPADSGKHLTAPQIALLTKWIEQGAKFEPHWSQLSPVLREPPAVKDQAWARSPVDRFILHHIEAAGLKPSPQADRRTLIRRLYFDLIGLPPTPEEVDAFVADKDPQAYEKLVERLLSNKHYGERMAIYWLDLVRYADSIGYHSDNPRQVWMYRDWVIDAFNKNMPFDQFTIDQLAGDLLPNATTQQKIASGYNLLLQTTEEGGAQPKEYMAKYAADRVRNLGEVWLAATTGCCECHDHKFDPYTTRDFYSLGAFFADIQEPAVGRRPQTPVPTAEFEGKLKTLESQLAAAEKELYAGGGAFEASLAKWEASVAEKITTAPPEFGPWHLAGPFRAASFDEAHDKAWPPEAGMVDLTAKYQNDKIKWQPRPKFKDGAVHTLKGDNSATYLFRIVKSEQATPMTVSLGSDDSFKLWVNEKLVSENKVQRGVAPDQDKATFNLAAGENRLLLKITNGGGGYGFYFKPLDAGLPGNIIAILRTDNDKRNDKQKQALARFYAGLAPELEPARAKVAALTKQRDALKTQLPTTLITVASNPRMMRVLPRGNWLDDSGPVVDPAVPAFFGKLEVDGRATRLDLARWLVDGKHPMVGRAYVNRLWKLFFGYGIARTLDDLGGQGEWPTHPDLLDWLAVEFVKSGWDTQHMVRLLVTSNTYRQSSLVPPALRERDPHNKLFARQSRFRLPAEMVRDNVLATSGLLVQKIGGPSVFPYQPAGYWQHLNFPQRTWPQGKGEDLYRRGLYTHWQRSFLHPSLLAFDATSREECTAERPQSNTPQQALTLLNDPTYVEAARVFAEHIVKQGGADPAARLKWAFRHALQREPTAQEQQVLSALLTKHLAEFKADPKAAQALISVGEWPMAQDVDVGELAAWTSIARVILNLHETISRT